MNTSYHAKRHSDTSKVTAGFTPGGHIASGYSYLQRSHSYKTSARTNVPQGLESPSAAKQFSFPSPSPSPTENPTTWLQRSSSTSSLTDNISSPRLPRQHMDIQAIIDLVAQLPPNPKAWTPSQVALYLTHVLGLTPKPVVQDVTNYVRSSGMGGKVFLRLREKDLEAEGLNLKWRKLMIEAVKKLRRDCLRGRIWGYEGGLQLPRHDDEGMEAANEEGAELEPKQVPVNAMGTLKRLRDKKAIKAMINNFENANDHIVEEETASFRSSGKGRRIHASLSSLQSIDSIESLSSRALLSPTYGKGFVKSLAESYTSLSDVSPQTSRKDFTREELEHWFGSMSDQEAEALANELQEDEELQQAEQDKHRNMNSRSYSSHSSVSGESEALTPPASEKTGFDLTPLDAEIIEAIVGQPLEPEPFSELQNSDSCVEALHRDDFIDDETIMFERSQSLTQLRADLLKGAKMNLYRGSTYEAEDIAALGLHIDDNDDIKYSTARKLARPPPKEEEIFTAQMNPSQDSLRVRKVDDNIPLAKDIFGSVPADNLATPDHMRRMSNLEARGLSPYKSVSPGMSRSSSQSKRHEGKKETKQGNMATYGRKGGLANKLQAGGLFDHSAATSEDSKKAEDESEWGVTVSRKASRRSTLAKAANRDRDNAAIRMADLFPQASSMQGEFSAENLKELEAVSSKEHLCVPLMTEGLSEDGKSLSRKRSMVLVERKKFEALARRMGVLESQLTELQATSLPSLSDLGSMSERGRTSRKLDEIFAVPVVPRSSYNEASEGQKDVHEPDSPNQAWSFPRMLGTFPSYVIGMSAGLTVVLLKEVMGKGRH